MGCCSHAGYTSATVAKLSPLTVGFMVAVQRPPEAAVSSIAAPTVAAWPVRYPIRSPATVASPRRPAPRPLPPLGFAVSGGAAVFQVAGDGLLKVADELAYAALDRADRTVVKSGPFVYLGLAPATIARVAYTAGSDLAHGIIAGR